MLFLQAESLVVYAQADDDIFLVSASEQQIIVKYTPQFQGVYSPSFRKERLFFEARNCSYHFCAGRWNLPVRKVLLQIPENSHAVISSIDKRQEFTAWNQIAPSGLISDSTLLQFAQNQCNEIDSALFNDQARLSAPGWFGEQRVCALLLAPISYDRDRSGFWFFRDMTITIDFLSDRNAPASKRKNEPSGASIYTAASLTHLSAKARKVIPITRTVNTVSRFSKKWHRITITDEGIQRLPVTLLLAAGIDPGDVAANRIHIYYGGGEELDTRLDYEPPGLDEIAVRILDENANGLLDEPDALLFYAQSVNGWRYKSNSWRYFRNRYNISQCYWLCIEDRPPKFMRNRHPTPKQQWSGKQVRIFRDRLHQEEEKRLPDNTGLDWMWEVWSEPGSRFFSFHLADSIAPDSASLICQLQGLSESQHLVRLLMNDQFLRTVDFGYKLRLTVTSRFSASLLSSQNKLTITSTSPTSSIGFDWFEMIYSRYLHAQNNQLNFYSSGYDGWNEFVISGFHEQVPMVFDITDPFSVQTLDVAHRDSVRGMISVVDSLSGMKERRFLAIVQAEFENVLQLTPVSYDLEGHLKSSANQADYLIITHESLQGPILDRFAEHRRSPAYWADHTAHQVMIVTTEQIYDQFANGMVDPAAIRNFLKYTFNHWQHSPTYVLLVGAATFDYKDHLKLGRTMLVPSFENGNKVSDDWFVNLTDDRYADMMIGRLQVHSQEELAGVINKIIRYDRDLTPGSWQARVTLAADDLFRNQAYFPEDFIFVRDAEILAQEPCSHDFDISRIYLTDFNWDRVFNKPAARLALIQAFNSGSLFINYLGHANWNMLAHEGLLRTPNDLGSLKNKSYLPLLFAGTCEVARIDDPQFRSMGELLLQLEEGGVVACIGSARWNMHQASFNVSKVFYRNLFDGPQRGRITIGQALAAAKHQAGFPDQTEVIFLLGDPAQLIAVPSAQIRLQVQPDTLSSMRRILLQGEIRNEAGLLGGFNGMCELRFYDSAQKVITPLYQYLRQGEQLFDGEFPVVKGRFHADFFTSTDSLQGGHLAKLVATAWQQTPTLEGQPGQAIGALDSLLTKTGWSSGQVARDSLGPEVTISINGMTVPSGATVTVTLPAVITGQLDDPASGFVNPLFTDLGLILKIDEQIVQDLSYAGKSEFLDSDYKKATFSYVLQNLPLGDHRLALTVYDRALNATGCEISVTVEAADMVITSVLNYPNPSRGHTEFTFDLSREATVLLKIYTLAGRCIRIFHGYGCIGFNRFPDGGWDGRDEDGDILANGVYLYKIIVQANETSYPMRAGRSRAEHIGKLIMAR